MLMCKLGYLAKCAESTFCRLSLSVSGNVVVSQREDGYGVNSRREGRAYVSLFLSVPQREKWFRLKSGILSRFLGCQSSCVTALGSEQGPGIKTWLELELGCIFWSFHDCNSNFPLPGVTKYQDKRNLMEKASMETQENQNGPEWTIWACLCSGCCMSLSSAPVSCSCGGGKCSWAPCY